MRELANGLPGLGGGTPADPAAPPPASAPAPIPAPPGVLDLYIKNRAAGLDDTNAALATAQQLRREADLRAGFRRAGDIGAGRPTDDTYRTTLMNEAERPMQELAARRANAPLALEEAQRVGSLASADIGAQQAAQLRDPGHPTNVAMRAALTKIGLPAGPGLTVAALPDKLWETIKPLADVQAKQNELAALAPGRAAEARKTGAEASRVAALTGPEAAKTTAEAGLTGAQAAVERQKLGIPAPGYEATGQVPRDPATDKELQNRDASQQVIQRNVNELVNLLGNKDLLLGMDKRAKAAAPMGKLLLKLKDEAASRGLPDTELNLFQNILGDPTQYGVMNAAGWSHIKTRLNSFKATAAQDHNAWVSSHGYRQTGAPTGGTTAATHYLISPNGRARIAADASGKPLPGAKEEAIPNG
jgi:hypothetical protein